MEEQSFGMPPEIYALAKHLSSIAADLEKIEGPEEL